MVTELNLTKFPQDMQKNYHLFFWNKNCDLPICLGNAKVMNEDRRKITAEPRQK